MKEIRIEVNDAGQRLDRFLKKYFVNLPLSAIYKCIRKDVKVNDVTTEEYGAIARRPKNSRLDKSKLEENGFKRLPSWDDALSRYLKEIGY